MCVKNKWIKPKDPPCLRGRQHERLTKVPAPPPPPSACYWWRDLPWDGSERDLHLPLEVDGLSSQHAEAWWGPEHVLQWCENYQHGTQGARQQPLFQEIQQIREELEPAGSKESEDWPWTEEPATWKLNNWTFFANQSTSFEAAVYSRKAWS